MSAPEQAQVQSAEMPEVEVPNLQHNPKARRFGWLMLPMLTLLAGLVRFYHLSSPGIWYDESMVFRRTCGSYAQLLDCLRTDGFVPLHYSLIWVIAQFFKLTPFVSRVVPAISGTLMVPAVYFLARQMVGKSASLLAAAFTACSGFMLFYSRDAKMYMDAWLMVTLNAGALLWWFRSGNKTAMLCWIASGAAACGIHFSSAIPVALSSLSLLTQRKLRWQTALWWVVGLILIFAGPLGYYKTFNRWQARLDEDGWRDSGLQWIEAYNYGRTGPQHVRFLSTTLLMGWEWPKDSDVKNIAPGRIDWPVRGAIALASIFAIACLPWPVRWRSRSGIDTKTEPQWRVLLWLSFWIVLPVYGFYCRSVHGFATPADWWVWINQQTALFNWLIDHRWVLIGGGLGLGLLPVMTDFFPSIRTSLLRAYALVAVVAVIVLLMQGTGLAMKAASASAARSGAPWKSIWVPRYMGFIFPMLAVAVGTMLARIPSWPVRSIAVIVVLGLNLTMASFRILGQTEPPVEQMAADVFAAERDQSHTVTWTHLRPSADYPGGENINGEVGQYYLQLLEQKPINPVLFRASVLARKKAAPSFRRMPWDKPIPADVQTIILWSQYNADHTPLPLPMFSRASNMPADWVIQSDEWFTSRDCWIWQDLAAYRRSVLVRKK